MASLIFLDRTLAVAREQMRMELYGDKDWSGGGGWAPWNGENLVKDAEKEMGGSA